MTEHYQHYTNIATDFVTKSQRLIMYAQYITTDFRTLSRTNGTLQQMSPDTRALVLDFVVGSHPVLGLLDAA